MIDLGNRLADGGLVQELLLVDQTGHQGDGAHLVDAPRQAFVSRIELDGGVWPNWAAANVKEKALPWRRPAVCVVDRLTEMPALSQGGGICRGLASLSRADTD